MPGDAILEGPENHHLANVMRIQQGETITLFDGMGNKALGILRQVGKRSSLVEVGKVDFQAGVLPIHLTVATALPKGDRESFMVEKLTELGVQEIVPLQTHRSVVHPKDAQSRLGRYSLEACKQCGRNMLPLIREMTTFEDFCKEDVDAAKWIMHPGSDPKIGPFGSADCQFAKARVLIGPEGGFTDKESSDAIAKGFKIWSHTPNILRVETAAITAASGFAALWAFQESRIR
jgi:16S rRNA (uracil1498-N3)-methyltransferase